MNKNSHSQTGKTNLKSNLQRNQFKNERNTKQRKHRKYDYASPVLGNPSHKTSYNIKTAESKLSLGGMDTVSEVGTAPKLDISINLDLNLGMNGKNNIKEFSFLTIDGKKIFYKIHTDALDYNDDENLILIVLYGLSDYGYFDPFFLGHWEDYAEKNITFIFLCIRTGYATTLISFLSELNVNEILLDSNPYNNTMYSSFSCLPQVVLSTFQRLINIEKIDDFTYRWTINKNEKTKMFSGISSNPNDKSKDDRKDKKIEKIIKSIVDPKVLGPVGKLLFDQMQRYGTLSTEEDKMNAFIDESDYIDNSKLINYGRPIKKKTDDTNSVIENVSDNTVCHHNLNTITIGINNEEKEQRKVELPPKRKLIERPILVQKSLDFSAEDLNIRKVIKPPKLSVISKITEVSDEIIMPKRINQEYGRRFKVGLSVTPLYYRKFDDRLIQARKIPDYGEGYCGTTWIMVALGLPRTVEDARKVVYPLYISTIQTILTCTDRIDNKTFDATKEFNESGVDFRIYQLMSALAGINVTCCDRNLIPTSELPQIYYARNTEPYDDVLVIYRYFTFEEGHFSNYIINDDFKMHIRQQTTRDTTLTIRITPAFYFSVSFDMYMDHIINCLNDNTPFNFPFGSNYEVEIIEYRITSFHDLILRTVIDNKNCLYNFVYVTRGNTHPFYNNVTLELDENLDMSQEFMIQSVMAEDSKKVLWINYFEDINNVIKEHEYMLELLEQFYVLFVYIYGVDFNDINEIGQTLKKYDKFNTIRLFAYEPNPINPNKEMIEQVELPLVEEFKENVINPSIIESTTVDQNIIESNIDVDVKLSKKLIIRRKEGEAERSDLSLDPYDIIGSNIQPLKESIQVPINVSISLVNDETPDHGSAVGMRIEDSNEPQCSKSLDDLENEEEKEEKNKEDNNNGNIEPVSEISDINDKKKEESRETKHGTGNNGNSNTEKKKIDKKVNIKSKDKNDDQIVKKDNTKDNTKSIIDDTIEKIKMLSKSSGDRRYGIFMEGFERPILKVITSNDTGYVEISNELKNLIRDLIRKDSDSALQVMLGLYYDEDV